MDAKTIGREPAYPWGEHGSVLGGLTKRELFSAMVFQQFMTGATLPPGFDAAEELLFAGQRAVEAADALLAALAKDGE